MADEPDLTEQAINKLFELALSSQLDEAKQVEVDIRTEPTKLVQGQFDSVDISGKGMTFKQAIRIEAIDVSTDAVTIDPLKAITGELELIQPLNAQVKLSLTEADLNQALASEYIRRKVQGLQIEHEGQVITFNVEQAIVRLQEAGQMAVETQIFLPDSGECKSLSAIAIPSASEDGYRIDMKFVSAQGEGFSLDFLVVLFNQVVELLDLRNLKLGGNSLQLQALEVYPGKLLLQVMTRLQHIPKV
ncbi:LmeA family phospholipid-binding protein [Egbenema bharatensis]|uniref:LmeA family phospholipid-binding protein n=1 Tax=Egbenema bharatensis TaxID=3463334 RepID=UPI003A865B45